MCMHVVLGAAVKATFYRRAAHLRAAFVMICDLLCFELLGSMTQAYVGAGAARRLKEVRGRISFIS